MPMAPDVDALLRAADEASEHARRAWAAAQDAAARAERAAAEARATVAELEREITAQRQALAPVVKELPDPRDPELVRAVETGAPVAKVRTLLLHGADVNARDTLGEPALYLAMLNNDAPMVALLLRHGASTSYVDDDGDNLLQVAAVAERPSPEIVLALLRSGLPVDDRALASAQVELRWCSRAQRAPRADIHWLLKTAHREKQMERAFDKLKFVR